MYFDFEDYHPDIARLARRMSWREGVLLSIIAHLVMVILILVAPKWFPWLTAPRRVQVAAAEPQPEPTARIHVGRAARRAARPEAAGSRAMPSDQDRAARAPERAKKPENTLPFSRGNTPERVERPPRQVARGQGPQPDPAAGQPQAPTESAAAIGRRRKSSIAVGAADAVPQPPARRRTAPTAARATAGGPLGDALRNLQRYVQREALRQPAGRRRPVRAGDPVRHQGRRVRAVDPPLHRAGQAQLVHPLRGDVDEGARRHHRSTSTRTARSRDLHVVGPCPSTRSTTPAFGALAGSNPTLPLPPDIPTDKAFFTVTFFYNEDPHASR